MDEDFPPDYRKQTWSPPEYVFIESVDNQTEVVVDREPRAFWLFQDNDTVIHAVHSLKSNKHSIRLDHIAIRAGTDIVTVNPGGLQVQAVVVSENRARIFWGPYTLGSFSMDLPYSPEHGPIPRESAFERRMSFPMLDMEGSSGNDVVYEERTVNTTVHIQYWGRAVLTIDDETVAHYQKNPDVLELEMSRYPDEFAPGGRLGELVPTCARVLKSYDPCMSPWAQPLTR